MTGNHEKQHTTVHRTGKDPSHALAYAIRGLDNPVHNLDFQRVDIPAIPQRAGIA